ncbi:RagB/SusD family nutrient uptake outer membrane protein [Fulvivirgaceae bacterium BMA10]|uniref:RagB/SusD family nutrient uptake outer membrane protein n=1 Tax=Splendidivirga corallicola TaxID=3051826 RepID=A0ABT8KH83_9BACT|nr:RagB/SusD family nutrient uptake outer membrane protein [Fulvivirgaceae bacterium BMA10]
MKNIKNRSIKIAFVLTVFTVFSCSEDFLELTPQQSVATENALITLDDFRAAITGVYDGLSSSNYYGRYFVLVPDVMSDNVKQNASANRAKEWAEYSGNATDFIPRNMWNQMYDVINRANNIINSTVELAPAVKAEQDQIIGEAYALRALVHHDLVRIYAQTFNFTSGAAHPGIPIVTEFDQFAEPSRNTVNEVYNQIVSDLTTAISMMNADRGSSTILSKLAVQGLLARVHLYRQDWANAEQLATEAINGSSGLTSNAEYVNAWMAGTPPDAMFEIAMTSTDNRGSDALGRMYITEGYGDYLPSNDVISLIPVGDVREQLFKGDPNLSGIYGPVRVNKFPSTTGEDNTPVLRLSEIYLIRAEARANLNNDTGAQSDLNAIRQRGLSTAADVTATGQALIDEILLERRIELMFEGHRLWDLMRNEMNVIRNQCSSIICEINYPDNRFILPIPADEINANPNIKQNDGY